MNLLKILYRKNKFLMKLFFDSYFVQMHNNFSCCAGILFSYSGIEWIKTVSISWLIDLDPELVFACTCLVCARTRVCATQGIPTTRHLSSSPPAAGGIESANRQRKSRWGKGRGERERDSSEAEGEENKKRREGRWRGREISLQVLGAREVWSWETMCVTLVKLWLRF